MMNSISLMGRLTADPETKTVGAAGLTNTTFTIAVDRDFSKEKATDFFNVVTWRQTADFAARYLKKGMMVGIVGSLQMRKWEGKDGKKGTSVEVVADKVHFAERKHASTEEKPAALDITPVDFAQIEETEDLPF